MNFRLKSAFGLIGKIWIACGLLAVATASHAAIIATSDQGYGTNNQVFTIDPHAGGTTANRGITTTRELRQTFQNPTTFDVRRIVTSLDINNAATGLLLKFYEVDDVNVSNIGNPVTGTLFHTLTIPAGTYTNSSQRMGFELSGNDVFSLPQRNSGTTGYALGISQIDTAGTNSGVWIYATPTTDQYAGGTFFTETGSRSGTARDVGLSISSVPEPTTAVLVLMGFAGCAALRRARSRGNETYVNES
jgi:hypothetical protein